MKKFVLILVAVLCRTIAAGEILFIPGWLTEKSSASEYETLLQEIYPDDSVQILFWHSNLTWWKAVDEADLFVPEVFRIIEEKEEKERAETILIGHSLGGRIAVKTAEALAEKKIRIKQIILLGAAYEYDADFAPMLAAAGEKCINIFSRNDSILKYFYTNARRKFAVGFCGAEESRYPALVQYNMKTSEIPLSNTDGLVALTEAINHLAINYLDELKAVVAGEVQPYLCEYDDSGVRICNTPLALPDNWVIPPFFNMTILDSCADWSLVYTNVTVKGYTQRVYFVIDPYGRIRMWNIVKYLIQNAYETGIKDRIVRK